MKVVLGTVARSGIDSHLGCDLPAGVRAALFHYVGKLRNGRGPAEYPSFLLSGGFGDSAQVVDLDVDREVEATLEEEAARQGLSLADLAGHAVLAYLAELDAIAAPTDVAAKVARS